MVDPKIVRGCFQQLGADDTLPPPWLAWALLAGVGVVAGVVLVGGVWVGRAMGWMP